jgi:hypothetical protein
MTIPTDFSGIQLTSAVSGIVTGVNSWYQGELQWYTNAKGQLCSADGTFRLGRHGAIIKSKSSELLNYGDEFGNIVEGSALIDGSVIAKKLSDSSKLATTSCVFSSPDYNTVAWTAGTLVLADGTSFSIQSGNTGDMTGMTYIYFDRAISQTGFQLAYDMTSIAYDGAILVCDAKQASSSDLLAHFVSINGYMLLNVNQLNVNFLSALSADLGNITTGLIRMGQATSFTAGAGVWVYGQGTASQFRAGNPATNKTISFDSGSGEVVFGSAVSLTWSQIAAGGGKPADDATVGATWGTNLGSIPIRFAETPSGAGLYICSSYMGYYNGAAWKTYMDSFGHFYLAGSGDNSLTWSEDALSVIGTYKTYSTGKRFALSSANNEMNFWDDSGLKRVRLGTKIFASADNTLGFRMKGGNFWIDDGDIDTIVIGTNRAGLGLNYATGVAELELNGSGGYMNWNSSFAWTLCATKVRFAESYDTTLVTNLNANYLQGNLAAAFLGASAQAVDSDKLDGSHASAFSPVAGSSSIVTVGALTTGSIGLGFTAIADTYLAKISTAGKVSQTAITDLAASTNPTSTPLYCATTSGGSPTHQIIKTAITIGGTTYNFLIDA